MTREKEKNVLHTMHDSELIKRYTLDRAGIMFLTDLIWDDNISDNMQKCHSARNGSNHSVN